MSRSDVIYEGETLIAELDLDDPEDLEEALEDFVDLEEGEDLYVSLEDGERLDVRKLRERET